MSKCILIAQARAELKTAMFRHLGPNEYQTLDFSPLKCRCVEIKPPPRKHVFCYFLKQIAATETNIVFSTPLI